MEELIKRLVELTENTLETEFYGLPEFRPNPDPASVAERFTRPDAKEFYTSFDPQDVVIASFYGEMFLPDFASLGKNQAGYAFHGHTHEVLEDWPKDMLVIGTCSEDPITLNPHQESEIFYAIHGIGTWKPLPIAADIYGFLKLCIAWLDMAKQRGDALRDESHALHPDSWALFVRLALDQGIPQQYLDNIRALR